MGSNIVQITPYGGYVQPLIMKFYNVNNLCDLFTNVAGDTILKSLKEIDLFPKI